MVDDASAVEGPEDPAQGPWDGGGRGGFRRGFGSGSGIRGPLVSAWDGAEAEATELAEARPNKEWLPCYQAGHLVKDMKIKSLEEIHLFSLCPSRSLGLLIFFLKDEVLKIKCPCKTIPLLASGPGSRHLLPLGITTDMSVWMSSASKAVATAIDGAIILAKLSIVPVRRGCQGEQD